MPTLTIDALDSVVGGLSIPRPIPEQPQQPENYPFFGPLIERDLTYKPEPDKGPPVVQEPDPGYAPYGAPERDASTGSPSSGDDSGSVTYDDTLEQNAGFEGGGGDSYDTMDA